MRIILVEPGEPANIGAAARALKTMGLAQLAFVRPQCNPLADPARWLAHGSFDILTNAQIYSTLPQATHGCALIGGFTARPRRAPLIPALSVEEFVRLALAALPAPSAAVFGSETNGLSNDDLALCTHLVTIPNAVRHPSLNLAQAVMIACYEYHRQSATPRTTLPLVSADDAAHFIEHARAALAATGARHSKHFLRRLRSVLLATPLAKKDLAVLHALLDLLSPRRPSDYNAE